MLTVRRHPAGWAVAAVAALGVAGMATGCGGSSAASAKDQLVEDTSVGPGVTFVESRSSVVGGERRIYLAPANVDLVSLVKPPTGFTPPPSDGPGSGLPLADGTLGLVSYAGANPTDRGSECAIIVSKLVDPNAYSNAPRFDSSSQQVMLVDFSC